MPAIRSNPASSSSSAATSSPSTDICDDDPLIICTCPTDPPPLDRTPIILSEKKPVRPRRVKNQGHIPRPRNAFIIFRSHYINFLKSKDAGPVYPDEDEDSFIRHPKKTQSTTTNCVEFQQNELSKIAAKVWNNMDPDERKPYSEEAKKEKEWHKKMYPDYVYRAPSANAEKTKSFKIKMKTGNPSERERQEQDYSDPSPPVPSDVELVGIPRQWLQESSSQQYDDLCLLQTHIGAEQDFVPTDSIPPLELCSSLSNIEQLKNQICPPQQPTYAVDLSPRSLAYEQYQAKHVSSSTAETMYMDEPLADPLIKQDGMTEPLGFEFSSAEASSSSSFLTGNVPDTSTSFKLNEASADYSYDPYRLSSFMAGSDSWSFLQNLDFDYDRLSSAASAFQVGSILSDNDKFMSLGGLDVDVPEFNFEVMNLKKAGGEDCRDDDDDDDDDLSLGLGLAEWAGYA